MAKKLKVHLDLNESDVKWYRETFPNGSLSNLMALLLQKYRESKELSPSDYARLAVEKLEMDQ